MDGLLKSLTGGSKFYMLSSFFLPRLSCCIGIAYLYRHVIHPFLHYDHLYLNSQNDSTLKLGKFYLHHCLRTITIFVGFFTGCVVIWRLSLSIYRRCCQPAKAISQYGKWAIIAGYFYASESM